ncbi:MAG: hypothetical protein K8S27_01140 [Candidatus Omnitrophica bacterium]|nr:hypothetical protein [Candidatus Omnitrophota bacterium]
MVLLKTITPFLLSFMIGLGLLNLIFQKRPQISFLTAFCLGGGLGLGISSYLTFLSYLFIWQLNKNLVIILHMTFLGAILAALIYRCRKLRIPFWTLAPITKDDVIGLTLLLIMSGTVLLNIHIHPYGGWDAWSVWNFKAKFLFEAGVYWENIFHPTLWRSSPHYPLLLPLINVWGWIFHHSPTHTTTQITTVIFNLITIGLIFSALKDLTRSYWSSLVVFLFFLQPYFLTLSSAQYADIVLSFYLFAGMLCFILNIRHHNPRYLLLTGAFLGFLSFVKPEGYVATGILLIIIPGILWKTIQKFDRPKCLRFFFGSLFLFSIIPFVFKYFYAPDNITMTNGLTSQTNPSTWPRLQTILSFYFHEIFKVGKQGWNGLWIVIIFGLLLSGKKIFRSETLVIPLFLLSYIGIVTMYYYVNTHFKIEWWLSVSFNRIELSLLPIITFWCFYSFWRERME